MNSHHVTVVAMAVIVAAVFVLAVLWLRALAALDAVIADGAALRRVLGTAQTMLDTQAATIAEMRRDAVASSRRAALLTNELRGSDDLCQTMVRPGGALPNPVQWIPERGQYVPPSSDAHAAVRVMGVRLT